jgi:hypothetical protein
MTTAELFKVFGGREVVMAVTGMNRNTVNHWLTEGVPYRHFAKLRKAAEKAGIRGITDEALESTRSPQPPPRRRRCRKAA